MRRYECATNLEVVILAVQQPVLAPATEWDPMEEVAIVRIDDVHVAEKVAEAEVRPVHRVSGVLSVVVRVIQLLEKAFLKLDVFGLPLIVIKIKVLLRSRLLLA